MRTKRFTRATTAIRSRNVGGVPNTTKRVVVGSMYVSMAWRTMSGQAMVLAVMTG